MAPLIALYLYTTESSVLSKPSLTQEAVRKGVTLLTVNSKQGHTGHHQMKSNLKGRPHVSPLVSPLSSWEIALLRPCEQL